MIDNYINKSNGRIIRHLQVEPFMVPDILLNADILISVGNSSEAFKPSKIFEYISTGKPIVHFYQQEYFDLTLNKYPLSLQLSQNCDNEKLNMNKMYDFCFCSKGQSIGEEIINEIFNNHSKSYVESILLDGLHHLETKNNNKAKKKI